MSPADIASAAAELEGAPAEEALRWAAERFPGRVGFATAFGATRFATRLLDRFAPDRTAVRRPAVRLVRVARIASALHSQCA